MNVLIRLAPWLAVAVCLVVLAGCGANNGANNGANKDAAETQTGCDYFMSAGKNAPKKRFDDIRGVQYSEFSALCNQAGNSMFNTTGLNNKNHPDDTAPTAQVTDISERQLARQLNVPHTWVNGPRTWVNDWIYLPVGPSHDFGSLKARWFAYPDYPPRGSVDKLFGTPVGTYKTTYIHRKSKMGFEKGKPVFILDDPNGTPWVMQSFTTQINKNLTYDNLNTLGKKLDLPKGWSFRVVNVKKELQIQALPNGTAPVTTDNLGNTYDGCKKTACSYKP